MAKAMLYLGTLKAFYSSSEFWTQDDIFVRVYTDDNTFVRWPAGNGIVNFDNSESNSMNMAVRVDYDTTVRIEVWDRDQPDDDNHPSNDLLGVYHLDRHSRTSGKLVDTTTSSARYELDYRILTNRIPTLRVLGVRCEKQSAGMNTPLLNGIVAAAKNVSDAAAIALKYNPRPRAKAMRAGFKAASEVLEGVQDFLAYIGQFIEGMDDVYLVHVPPGGDPHVDGRFFPPKDGPKTYQMEKDTEVYFQEQYGSYFRFPIDREDVTIQFREHDPHSFDIDIGRITIPKVPSSASADDLDGSAKIEVAVEFDAREDGQGAVYQICYAVGMEDWCLDATVEAQGGPDVMPTPPYPFQDRVTAILTDTAEAWARSVLSLYKPSTSIQGHFDATKRSMTSVQEASLQSVVIEWADSAADVVSIIAVVGGGAAVVDIKIYTPDQPPLEYQGWNGTTWADGPATAQNDVYWYRARVTRAQTLYAKTYRQGEVGTLPFTLYAYVVTELATAPTLPFPFPNADSLKPVLADSEDAWVRGVLGINKSAPNGLIGTFVEGTNSVSSEVNNSLQSIVVDWGEDCSVGAVSVLAVVGQGAPMVRAEAHSADGNSRYKGWNGTAWVEGVATPQNGVYWYRAVVPRARTWFAKSYLQQGVELSAPFSIFAYLDTESLIAPARPFPFPDVVTAIVAESAQDWAVKVLGINRAPTELIGCYENKNKTMTSTLLEQGETEEKYYGTLLVRWAEASNVGRVSILAVMGPAAVTAEPQIESPAGTQRYQGWNGSTWVDGPATPQNGVCWYRCMVTQASALHVRSLRQTEAFADAYLVYAYLGAAT